jgi:phosphoglycerate dehydrogenase-like enzyme
VEASLGVAWRDLEALFADADVVALCATLTRTTDGLVGADLIGRMRRGAVLINTSRGRVLDEHALADALEDGRLAAAGLDVYRREVPHPDPGPTDERLLAMDDVVLTPHIGTSARETREWMAGQVVDAILDHLRGRRPATLLNPEVYGGERRPGDRIG